MANPDNSEKNKPTKEVVVIKNTYDYQRMKLERLMKNPVMLNSSNAIFLINLTVY